MIIIDTICESTGFPVLFEATKIYPYCEKTYGNANDEKLSQEERDTPTEVRYLLMATTICNGVAEEVAIEEYDTPEAVVKIYDCIVDCIAHGVKIFYLRQTGEGLGDADSEKRDGDHPQDRQLGAGDSSDGIPKIL